MLKLRRSKTGDSEREVPILHPKDEGSRILARSEQGSRIPHPKDEGSQILDPRDHGSRILHPSDEGSRIHDPKDHGQGLVEFLITLPVWMLLFWMIWSFALYWWTQVSAATAVHEGVSVIAQGGTIPQGRAEAGAILEASLGPQAEGLEEQLFLRRVPGWRSVIGEVRASWRSPLRAYGFPDMPVGARSFQREERFYGGAPDGWE